MRLEKATIAVVLVVIASAIPAVATGQDFKVVVNQANSTTSITKENLSDCFMKQAGTYTWISGQPLIPIDQSASSETRKAFSKAVHDRDVSAIKNFWQRQIFSGKSVPPQEKATDAEVLDFVRGNPGAVGYVSAKAEIGSGVKVLEITEE